MRVQGAALRVFRAGAGRLSSVLLAISVLAGLSLSCSGVVSSPAVASVAPESAPTASPVVPEVPPTACTAVTPSPMATPTSLPAKRPTPTPTRGLVIAVAESILVAEPGFFERLEADARGAIVRACRTSTEAQRRYESGEAEAAIVCGRRPSSDAVRLRSIPYVLAGFPGAINGGFTLDGLRRIYSGGSPDRWGVICGTGLSEVVLLGLDRLDSSCPRYDHPKEALAYVASHEQAVALLPWESVDFRVQLLPIEGQRLWDEPLREYPHTLDWWLSGDLDGELLTALLDGLRYRIEEPLSLSAVGDIMLDRFVGQIVAEESPLYPFEDGDVRRILVEADLAFGNLECPVSARGAREDKGFEFRASPVVIEGLSYAGFDVLSLANNHTGDYGDVALVDTMAALCGVDIYPVGAGDDLDEANALLTMPVKGLRVGFLAFNAIGPSWFAADESSPGSAWLDEEAVSRVGEAAARTDLLFVSCHWGTEYSVYPTSFQRRMARELIDAGADLVIGHHPHVLQAVQYFDAGFVAYSLGNFVFDQFFSDEVRQGAILHCLADRSGLKSVELIPTYNVRTRPRLLGSEDGAKVLDRVFRATREIDGLPPEVR